MSGSLCKMCGEAPAGVKAHIIPRALYADIDTDDEPLYSIPADPAERAKRSRTGVYDTTILCGACEDRFKLYDDHGVWALRQEPVPNGRWGNPHVAELPGADAVRLKLFFMHVLWRAHESVQPEFRSVDLGPRAASLRALLLTDDPGPPDQFGVVLLRYAPDPDGLHNVITAPARGRWTDGGWFVEFRLRNWQITVTTASAGVPRDWRWAMISPDQPVPVLATSTPFREDREAQDIIRLLNGRR